MANEWIGVNVPRKEGRQKVTGERIYIDDFALPDMIYGATVRSPIARGKIKEIVFEDGVDWSQFVVVTAKDIPGENVVNLILDDQPYLASVRVNHVEEPVILLAHPDKYELARARKLVRIEVEEETPLHDTRESDAKSTVVWGKDNVQKNIKIEKGDVDAVWANAAHVIEAEYETGAQEQLYIENNGAVATYSEEEGVTVWGSLQCPYYVHKALKRLFSLADEKIRVVQAETGGGFGGKEEYPSMICGHAGLLAKKSGKPVKIVYDRREDMAATTKRHPSRTRHKTAVDADGKLLAMDIDFVLDGGAYATLSAVVLSRGAIHAAGPYRCPNVRVSARALATNSPPHGAFRGFGAPQSIFALERHMDRIANTLGMDPDKFRAKNYIKKGERTATSQEIKDTTDMQALVKLAHEQADYHRKRREYADFNKSSPYKKKGIGFASFFHGAGFTGSGEKMLASQLGLEGTPSGTVRVLAASTEIGQGTNTIFSQIAAETLGVSIDMIEVAQPDTKFVPDSGPTVASRTVMVVGGLVEKAALQLKKTLQDNGSLSSSFDDEEFRRAVTSYMEKNGSLKCMSQYELPSHIKWDENTYKGDAYATYAWACYVADVEVDLVTWQVEVKDFVAVQEAGHPVNPIMATGQIEGGVAQAIGYAIYEDVVWKNGAMANNGMTNYIMPTSYDLPPIRVTFHEEDTPYGPGKGAKGIGELPMDGTAPAIVNAIEDATGWSVNQIPVTPEVLRRVARGE